MSQLATSNAQAAGRSGWRDGPRVFTKHVARIAATILKGSHAVEFSLCVVRASFRLHDLANRLGEREDNTEALAMNHDTFSRNTCAQRKQVFDALRERMTPPHPPKRPIGCIGLNDKGKKTSSEAKYNTRHRGPPRAQLVFPENSMRERNLLGREKLSRQVQESNCISGWFELKDHFDLEFSWLLIWKRTSSLA
jgi:hypothetical protein